MGEPRSTGGSSWRFTAFSPIYRGLEARSTRPYPDDAGGVLHPSRRSGHLPQLRLPTSDSPWKIYQGRGIPPVEPAVGPSRPIVPGYNPKGTGKRRDRSPSRVRRLGQTSGPTFPGKSGDLDTRPRPASPAGRHVDAMAVRGRFRCSTSHAPQWQAGEGAVECWLLPHRSATPTIDGGHSPHRYEDRHPAR